MIGKKWDLDDLWALYEYWQDNFPWRETYETMDFLQNLANGDLSLEKLMESK